MSAVPTIRARRLDEAPAAASSRPLAGFLRRFSFCASRWRQRRALADLPDHLLRDIGVTREQATREASRPFWDRISPDASASAERSAPRFP